MTMKKSAASEQQARANPLLHIKCTVVRLGDTDAAGRWFYPRWIEMAHRVYEDWLEKSGLPLARIMTMPVLLPIVRCEADFSLPSALGDHLDCYLWLVEIREKAFVLDCTARRGGELVARCVTTHVAVDKSTNRSVALPDVIRSILENQVGLEGCRA